MKPNTLVKTAFATLIFVIAGLVFTGSWSIYHSAITPTVPGEQKKSILTELVNSVTEEPDIEMHVSYNSLTEGHSKTIAYKDDEKKTQAYILMGRHNSTDRLFRCEVSKGFWDSTEENSHVRIPSSKCQEIQP